jgi:uncharacterized protein (DUF924 family)
MRAGAPRRDDVRDPRREHPRLARACPRQHENRPVHRLHRLSLLGVQRFEIARRAGHGGLSARGKPARPRHRRPAQVWLVKVKGAGHGFPERTKGNEKRINAPNVGPRRPIVEPERVASGRAPRHLRCMTTAPLPSPSDVVAFWREAGPQKWYAKDDAFDAAIHARFHAAHEAAASGRLWSWEETADGALALLILLDQFPRNLFRGSAHAFATDAAALNVAERAIARGFDAATEGPLRQFFYLPHMHAEDVAAQRTCVDAFERLGEGFEENLKFARAHLDAIERFGRFPHRNPLLGRLTTPEEQAFLDGGGYAG